jgi:hypothetical protein
MVRAEGCKGAPCGKKPELSIGNMPVDGARESAQNALRVRERCVLGAVERKKCG